MKTKLAWICRTFRATFWPGCPTWTWNLSRNKIHSTRNCFRWQRLLSKSISCKCKFNYRSRTNVQDQIDRVKSDKTQWNNWLQLDLLTFFGGPGQIEYLTSCRGLANAKRCSSARHNYEHFESSRSNVHVQAVIEQVSSTTEERK